MEALAAILLIVLIVMVSVAIVRSQENTREREIEQQEAKELELREQETKRREAVFLATISAASGPADVLAICDHSPPVSLRFQRSEQPIWVVNDCAYLKTTKEVSYEGGSTGGSFRIAKGVTIRSSGSRGRRVETESFEQVDYGTVVLTTKHVYFQGRDKERFRVRLDKLVSMEAMTDGVLFQRDGLRARPEAFISLDARLLAALLVWLEAPPDSGGESESNWGDDPDDGLDVLGASQADGERGEG